MVEDLRRLCNYFVLYTPRKTDKTGMSAFIQVVFFLMGDYNSGNLLLCECRVSEPHSFQPCHLHAERRLHNRLTSPRSIWKPIRSQARSTATAGKTKENPFEGYNWDEWAFAYVTEERHDGIGQRNALINGAATREGLTFGTTTAGTIANGPFIEMLSGLHENLLRELRFYTGEEQPTLSDDRQLSALGA